MRVNTWAIPGGLAMGEIRWHEAVGKYDVDDCDLAVFCLGFLREVCLAIDDIEGDEYGDRYREMIHAMLAREPLLFDPRPGSDDDRGRSTPDGRPG